MGSDPSKLFPFEALKKQFKTRGVYAAVVGSLSIAVQTANESTVPDVTEKGLVVSDNIFLPKDDSYDRRILELVTDLVEYGYI